MSLYVGDHLVCTFGWNCSSMQTYTLDDHLHRVKYTTRYDMIWYVMWYI